MKRTALILILTGVVVLLGWLVVDRFIGPPMSTDLSRIGEGHPTLVLVFESYSPAGMAGMEVLNSIRDDYEPEVVFLVADTGTPGGSAFASRYQVPNGAAVLLDGQGAPLNIYSTGGNVADLRDSLDQDLGR